MKNFIFFTVIITVLIIIGGVFINTVKNENKGSTANANLNVNEYFWSETCPHCKNVADFMQGWDKNDQFPIEKIEINSSVANQNKFLSAGASCNIKQENLGVPLLVTPDGQCFEGDSSIIDYLKSLD